MFPALPTLPTLPTPPAWPEPVMQYRSCLQRNEEDPRRFSEAARSLREWMVQHDPDYPIFHLAAPEGWANDPNGLILDADGLYHRFFQYDRTFNESCMHGSCSSPMCCTRVWGQTVSRDLVTWEDWPGVYGDSEWDARAVFSGNCALRDDGRGECIYSGGRKRPCDTGVCAVTSDWLSWNKTGCMQRAPSTSSQTNHDTAILRAASGAWHIISGGCTLDGHNDPAGKCDGGNAQVWTSKDDLATFDYMHPLAPGGFGGYWELPYILPFDEKGRPLRADEISKAASSVLAVGTQGHVKYWVGTYDAVGMRFVPDAAGSQPAAWPDPRDLDGPCMYAFNPSLTDERAALGAALGATTGGTRRLHTGWAHCYWGEMGASAAARDGRAPYWQGAHTLLRELTLAGSALVQQPAAETKALRGAHASLSAVPLRDDGGSAPPAGVRLDGVRGDALELEAEFELDSAREVGLRLRRLPLGFSCVTSYRRATRTLVAATVRGGARTSEVAIQADALPQPGAGRARLRVFLDRSVVEVYSAGAALTAACVLPADVLAELDRLNTTAAEAASAEAFAEGGNATLARLDAWTMGTMWGPVPGR